MDQGPVARRLTDFGIASVQFVVAAALALLLFIAMANLVVVQYGRGAIRSALEQGARAGSVARSTEACEATIRDVVDQLLGGRMSDGLTMACTVNGVSMAASASAVFESWTFLTPDFEVSISTEAYLEPEP